MIRSRTTGGAARAPLRALTAALVLAAAPSCDRDPWSPDELLHGGAGPALARVRRGQQQYTMYCAGCHGEKGDGEGPAARFLDPKPRDFRKGKVKFAAVPAGMLPRDEDLLRTIDHGLAGTSMPSWHLVAEEDQRALVAYVKTFSDAWQKEAPGVPVAIKEDPFRRKPARGIAEGERVYHGIAACSSCHPAYATRSTIFEHMKSFDIAYSGFRDDLYRSVVKDSEWGAPIKPPDFLVDHTKSARTKGELVWVIAAGVGGTAMPSWGQTLSNQQLWGLAYYVESLIEKRGTPEADELRKELDDQPPFTPPAPPPSAAPTTEETPAAPRPGK